MRRTKTVHVIEETDEIIHAISLAAKLWPEIAAHREMVLGKILEAGLNELEKRDAMKMPKEIAGDLWPANWKQELRNDWPD